jgi:hypothetical protein
VLGFEKNMQWVKINVDLGIVVNYQLIELLKEFKDIFVWTYKDLKGIPLDIAQHRIELDTLIPPSHQTKILCRNPSLGLTTKARACENAGQEGSPGVTFHAAGSAKECEGMNLHTPKGTLILGVGVPVDF